MPPQSTDSFKPATTEDTCPWYQPLCKVTPVSKYLAMIIFILMPFVGGYIGYRLAPEKVVEVQVVSTPVKEQPKEVEDVAQVPSTIDLSSVDQNEMNHLLFEGKRTGYFIQSGKVYFAMPETNIDGTDDWKLATSASLLPDAESQSFRVLFSGGATQAGWAYAADAKRVYYNDTLLDMAEASTARAFGHFHSVLQSDKGVYVTGHFVAPGTIENLEIYSPKTPVDEVESPYSLYVHDKVGDLWYSSDNKIAEPIKQPTDIGEKWVIN